MHSNRMRTAHLLTYGGDLCLWTETPLPGQRPPSVDRDPLHGQRPPPGTETPLPGQTSPRQRTPWTETPWTETSPGQRPPGHVTCDACWHRDPHLWTDKHL